MATGVSAGGPTLEIADFGFSNSLQARGNSRMWKFEWWTEKSNLSVFLLEMGVRVFVSVVLQHDWCLKEAAKRDSCFQ